MTEVGLMAARAKLTGLNRELRRRPRTVVSITHRGKPSMTLMSSELYDTLVETLEVMANPIAVDALRKSLSDIEAGRVHTLDEVAARLGLDR
jgi:PHD/YefM family antitoxin component YafN of YafNO toxin-antitoxin module